VWHASDKTRSAENRIMDSANADAARAGSQRNDPTRLEGRDARMSRAADWNRALSLWLGQDFIDRFESPLTEQLETGFP
jgi:hypothetical protein